MNTCTCCKGSGKQVIKAQEFGRGGNIIKLPDCEIECVICDGKGTLSDERVQALKEHQESWCTCKGQKQTKYIDNTPGARVSKHHWIHKKASCGKIVQIGLERHTYAS
jgi:hypothetical protein